MDNNSRNCDRTLTEPSGRNHSVSRRPRVTRDTAQSAGLWLWCVHDRDGLRDQAMMIRHDIDQALDFWNIVDRLILVDNSGPTKRILFILYNAQPFQNRYWFTGTKGGPF